VFTHDRENVHASVAKAPTPTSASNQRERLRALSGTNAVGVFRYSTDTDLDNSVGLLTIAMYGWYRWITSAAVANHSLAQMAKKVGMIEYGASVAGV